MTWAQILESVKYPVQIMWQGMVGIFVVMAAISLIVLLLTKIIKKK